MDRPHNRAQTRSSTDKRLSVSKARHPGRAADTRGEPAEIGPVVRRARAALRLSLDQLAARVSCAKSYLSAIETCARANPPSEALLARLEHELGLARGTLCAMAQWHNTPEPVRASVLRLRSQQEAAEALVSHLRRHAGSPGSAPGASIDDLYRSGELRRLVDRVSPEAGGEPHGPSGPPRDGADTIARLLPAQVPLINLVAAGAPVEFTDLGYPARVADRYVNAADTGDADAFAARVAGDSMEPLYREGDIVVFSPARPVKSGTDCFVRLEPDHETTFKRVYFEGELAESAAAPGVAPEPAAKGEQLIRLQPLNSAHAPRVVPRERVAGMYAAVSVTRAV